MGIHVLLLAAFAVHFPCWARFTDLVGSVVVDCGCCADDSSLWCFRNAVILQTSSVAVVSVWAGLPCATVNQPTIRYV